jgi:hypothetical protein
VHRIFAAQAGEQRIGIGQHLRIEEMVEAQGRIGSFASR